MVDVIIPVYNREKYIAEAIESVLNQTFQDFTIIISDDGSNDGTGKIIKKYETSDSRVKSISHPHKGLAHTLNTAINYSTNKYLAFLDSDDYWHKEKLEKQIHFFEEFPDYRISFGHVQEFTTKINDLGEDIHVMKDPVPGISKISMMCERVLFDEFGYFDDSYKVGDHIEWMSRLFRANIPYGLIDDVLAYRRIHTDNMTNGISNINYLKVIKQHLDAKRNSDAEK